VNQERDLFGYVPQHVAPDSVQAFPRPFLHRIHTLNQLGAENHRRLAYRYLHHRDAQVGMVSMETGAAGQLKVVIILEMPDVFLSGVAFAATDLKGHFYEDVEVEDPTKFVRVTEERNNAEIVSASLGMVRLFPV